MAADDYYTHLARMQLERLEANRAQCLADLQAAKASADYDSAGQAVSELADIGSKKANLVALHQQYVASQTPVQLPELTPEEKAAKPISAMDYGDVWEMSATSKYASMKTYSVLAWLKSHGAGRKENDDVRERATRPCRHANPNGGFSERAHQLQSIKPKQKRKCESGFRRTGVSIASIRRH